MTRNNNFPFLLVELSCLVPIYHYVPDSSKNVSLCSNGPNASFVRGKIIIRWGFFSGEVGVENEKACRVGFKEFLSVGN